MPLFIKINTIITKESEMIYELKIIYIKKPENLPFYIQSNITSKTFLYLAVPIDFSVDFLITCLLSLNT